MEDVDLHDPHFQKHDPKLRRKRRKDDRLRPGMADAKPPKPLKDEEQP